jgi:hypothetical protein
MSQTGGHQLMTSLINWEQPSWILVSGSIPGMGDTWCKNGYSGSFGSHLGFKIADVIN